MLRKITLAVALLLLAVLPGCKKQEIPDLSLPAKTETGQKTLGFMLNDTVWANYGRRCTFYGCRDNTVEAKLHKQPDGDFQLGISAGYTVTSKLIDQSFYLNGLNMASAGIYALDTALRREMVFFPGKYVLFRKEYRNIVAGKCIVVITRLDTVQNVISGLFNGVLYNPMMATDSIVITDGRFDTKLEYLR